MIDLCIQSLSNETVRPCPLVKRRLTRDSASTSRNSLRADLSIERRKWVEMTTGCNPRVTCVRSAEESSDRSSACLIARAGLPDSKTRVTDANRAGIADALAEFFGIVEAENERFIVSTIAVFRSEIMETFRQRST